MKRISDLSLVAAVAAQVFVAVSPLLAAYRVPGTVAVLVLAAASPAAVSRLSARVAAPVSFLASAVGAVSLLLVACGADVVDLARAAVDGPERLLTETLPLTGDRVVLSAAVIVVWTTGAVTSELLVRTTARAGRAPAALLVPVVVYVLLYAATSSAPGASPLGGPVLLVVTTLAAVLSVGSRHPGEQERGDASGGTGHAWRWRSPLAGVAAAGLVAAVLAAGLPHVRWLEQPQLTVYRPPPVAIPVITDPLELMAEQRDGAPPVAELQVSTDAPSDGYLGLADLDFYDGARWSFDAAFEPTGGRIPGASAVDPGRTVGQEIDVTGSLPVPLLPALDRPLEVSGLAVSADAQTGMFLPQSADPRISYHVVSQAPSATLGRVPVADGIAAPPSPQDLELPPQTAAALATAERYTADLTGMRPAPSVAYLQAVLTELAAQDRRIVGGGAGAPPRDSSGGGTSLSEVLDAVTVDRAATPEQFATFLAVIARGLGVPARLVTGFRLVGTAGGPLLPAGTYSVSSSQAWAWVEIPVAGLGWVVADPTPNLTTAAGRPPPERAQATLTTLPSRLPTVVARGGGPGGHPLAPAVPRRVGGTGGGGWPTFLAVAVGLIAVMLVAGPGQLALRRRLRRHRRRQGSPAARVVGAWLELLDTVARAGMRLPVAATAVELAAEIGHHFGPEPAAPAAQLAAIADRAVFCLRRPPTTRTAAMAWDLQRAAARSITAALTPRQRLNAIVRR